MIRLYIEDDTGNIRILPFDAPSVSIGRGSGNDVVLEERNISRHHARVLREGNSYFLVPVKPRYGLKINGLEITKKHPLALGEIVEIGDFRIKVLAPEHSLSVVQTDKHKVIDVSSSPAGENQKADTVRDIPILHGKVETPRQVELSDLDSKDAEIVLRGSLGRFFLVGFLLILALALGAVYLLSAPVSTVSAISLVPPASTPHSSAMVENAAALPQHAPTLSREELLLQVREVILQGNLLEAEDLLKTCPSPECRKELRRIADAHNALGNPEKAREMYQRLYRSSTDSDEKVELQKSIGRLSPKLTGQ